MDRTIVSLVRSVSRLSARSRVTRAPNRVAATPSPV